MCIFHLGIYRTEVFTLYYTFLLLIEVETFSLDFDFYNFKLKVIKYISFALGVLGNNKDKYLYNSIKRIISRFYATKHGGIYEFTHILMTQGFTDYLFRKIVLINIKNH